MTSQKPSGPYVYQPIGALELPNDRDDGNRELRGAGRLWGVGGVGFLTQIKGLTKPEAEAIVEALERLGPGAP